MNELVNQIQIGNITAFVDEKYSSDVKYRPQFVFNNAKEGRKVASNIEEELLNCDSFMISVAFITQGGIIGLKQILQTLEKRNVRGKILTTDYLTFSEPKALDDLAGLSNIEVKMYCTENVDGFHTKGYIFKKNDVYKVIVGSSNLTSSALSVNKEWNTKLISTDKGEYIHQLLDEFESLWNSDSSKYYNEIKCEYEKKYNENKNRRENIKQIQQEITDTGLKPNLMQAKFIENIRELKASGEKRALLISATGTGKTYASAFAMKDFAPKKALFLVHREQIAKKSMESYRKVIGDYHPDGTAISYGLLSGNQKDLNADYLFSTIQMMSKPDVMKNFAPGYFDFICIDESHHSPSKGYTRVIEYYNPRFLLGMTATPERPDSGDIFHIFDHNIAYEIRLQGALEQNLLCPFHYFGISEGSISENESNDQSTHGFTDDRYVDYIVKQAQYYGYSGERVKGLVFCKSIEEAKLLSEKFNEREYHGKKYRTVALFGDSDPAERERCIELLTKDLLISEDNEYLDYIFTRDIFNEGIDIPEVNQVLMLRETDSPIVFVQQLGRGLRKADFKEYVVILDFIGNYSKNYLIPIALSGDRTYNKDNVRRFVEEGNRIIPGQSSIHFDEVSKQRIYQSIDDANFNEVKLIKESYKLLKWRLGRIPKLMDFDEQNSLDPLRIFESNTLGSYYEFLSKYEKDHKIYFSDEQRLMLKYISKKFAAGKRPHELLAIKYLLEKREHLMDALKNSLVNEYCLLFDNNTEINIINNLTGKFNTGTGRDTYSSCAFIEPYQGEYVIAKPFSTMLMDSDFYNTVKELVDFGLYRNHINYNKHYKNMCLQLYAKYTYEDVCRLLDWHEQVIGQNIGGYKLDKNTKTMPIFVNYVKGDNIAEHLKFDDRFVSEDTFIAISKPGRDKNDKYVQMFAHAQDLGIKLLLFVRKNKVDLSNVKDKKAKDTEAKEFYFLGEVSSSEDKLKETIMEDGKTRVVEIEYHLDKAVRNDIYHYLVD